MLLAPRIRCGDGRPRLPSRLLLRLASLAAGHPVGLDEFLDGEPLRAGLAPASPAPAFSDDAVWVDERERDAAAAARALGARHGDRALVPAEVLGDPRRRRRRSAPGARRAAPCPAPGRPARRTARAPRSRDHPFDAECIRRAWSATSAVRSPSSCATCSGSRRPTSRATRSRWTPASSAPWRTTSSSAPTSRSSPATCAATAPWRRSRGLGDVLRRGRAPRRHRRGALLGGPARDAAGGPARDGAPRPGVRGPASRPVGVEWRFGEAVDRPVVARSARRPHGALRRPARPHRRDRRPAPASSTTSRAPAARSSARIKDGLSVQLPVYRLAVRQAGDEDYGADLLPLPAGHAPRRLRGPRPAAAEEASDASPARARRRRGRARRRRHVPAHHAAALRLLRRALRLRRLRVGQRAQARARPARARVRSCSRPQPRRPPMAAERLVCDQDVRDRVTGDLGTTFLLEAGAGTGKTRVLVDRYVQLRPRPGARHRATCARWRRSRSPRRPPVSCASASARSSSGWRGRPPVTPRARRSSRARSTRSTTRPSAPSTASPAACCASSPSRPASTRRSSSSTRSASDLERGRLWEEWLTELAAGDPAAGATRQRLSRLLRAGVRLDWLRRSPSARRASSASATTSTLELEVLPEPDLLGALEGLAAASGQAGRALLRRLRRPRRQGLRRRDGLVDAGRALPGAAAGGRRPARGRALRAAGQGPRPRRPAAPRATGTRRTAARTSC